MKVLKIALKTHEIAPFFKIFFGGHARKPPIAKARSFAARDMPLRGMYIKNPRNFKIGPPPPLRNPAYAPDLITAMHYRSILPFKQKISCLNPGWSRKKFLTKNLNIMHERRQEFFKVVRGVARIWQGANNFFFQIGNMHVAKLHSAHGFVMCFARGFGGICFSENFF